MEPTVTKRLHISGLTPSISHQDLSQRLSTFGNIKSLHGIGAFDGVGRPKKFAYATLEATPAKLSKCMNILSGSTWKGAKLRIGEAKPDFRERIQAENEKYAVKAEPPRKKSRLKYAQYQGRHAENMSPITIESAKLKGGWVVTPLGRIYRPLRMRPPRPLTRLAPASSSLASKVLKRRGSLRERKRIKKPEVRARRRKIDMVKYGSEYLKGRFLDIDVPPGVGGGSISREILQQTIEESSDEDDTEFADGAYVEEGKVGEEEAKEDEADAEENEDHDTVPPIHTATSQTSISIPAPFTSVPESHSSITSFPTSSVLNLDQEKEQTLSLLVSLFGSSAAMEEDEDDWIGRESLDSDVDEAALTRVSVRPQTVQNNAMDFEIVPRDGARNLLSQQTDNAVTEQEVNVEVEEVEAEVSAEEQATKESHPPLAPQQRPAPPKLKDLFAPTEAKGGFSLLGHLNLEDGLELDEDVPFLTTQEADDSVPQSLPVEPQTISVPTTSATKSFSQITLDPSQPLFFPLTLLASHPGAADTSFVINPDAKNRPKDLYDTLKAKGWDWRTSGFYRTQTEDEIRQRWEEQKGELTQGWKKRWREAGRIGRRRGNVGDGEDG